MDFTIRNARADDLDALEALERQCFSVPWTRDMLFCSLPDERHELLLACGGDELFGYVGLMSVLDEGYISNVAVAPAYRRRGIASALLDALLRRAEEKELAFVSLEVRAGNAPAIALYERFGFAEVGRRRGYYSAPKEDALLMTKMLK